MRRAWIGLLVLAVPAVVARADDGVSLKNFSPAAGNRRDEPIARAYSRQRAVHFLDTIAVQWQQQKACFSCHTNYAYLYARPTVGAEAPAHAEIRQALEALVTERWPAQGPRWDAEVVAAAAALAHHDASTSGKLHAATRTALGRMWKLQQADGGWGWLKCGWPPLENDDHYGVTLAALAAGVAPEGYARNEEAQQGLKKLRGYLDKHPPENAHHKAMLLWAHSYLPDLLRAEHAGDYVKELRALQRPDGGWASAGLGDWKRSDKKMQEPETSDGYGTGFVIYVLRRAGVNADDDALQAGVRWLKANQRESGRWFTRSLTTDRGQTHYLSHAGSAFAVMALQACEPAGKRE